MPQHKKLINYNVCKLNENGTITGHKLMINEVSLHERNTDGKCLIKNMITKENLLLSPASLYIV